MSVDRLPNLLIVFMALVGSFAIVRSCIAHWHETRTISKAAHGYTLIALLFNAGLHIMRIGGTVAPNNWFLTAVVLLVSSATMTAIIGIRR